uniref:Uncharacterized protein LOC104234211 n=1 Tax=Nicotiana sylvestris TaxID=4096 RepID=A0A1U7X5C1_NICSY|nr:PREDICTED: uncharacterized protein LOC104234211 [Nicotiana sylvestris]
MVRKDLGDFEAAPAAEVCHNRTCGLGTADAHLGPQVQVSMCKEKATGAETVGQDLYKGSFMIFYSISPFLSEIELFWEISEREFKGGSRRFFGSAIPSARRGDLQRLQEYYFSYRKQLDKTFLLQAVTTSTNGWTDAGHAVNQVYDMLYMMGRDDIVVGMGGEGGILPNGTILPNVGGYLPIIDQENGTAGYCRYRQAIPMGLGGRLDIDSSNGFRKSFLPQARTDLSFWLCHLELQKRAYHVCHAL